MNFSLKFFFIQTLFFPLLFSATLFCELNQSSSSLGHEIVFYIIDTIKMVLGLGAIIGGFGFFVATSSRKAHWHPRLRRVFFGIFLFSNIVLQALFNVVNISNNKRIITALSKCLSYWC